MNVKYIKAIGILLMAFPLSQNEPDRILDKDYKTKEYRKEQDSHIEIYDEKWKRKGYIIKRKGEWEFYDDKWRREGYGNEKDALGNND